MSDHDGAPDAPGGADDDLSASLRRLAGNMGELAGVASVAFVLLDPATGDLETRVLWGATAASETPGPLPEETVEGRVARRLEQVIVEDARKQPPPSVVPDQHPGSLVCLPLVEADRLLGTLTATAKEPRAFDARRLRLLQVFADQAALAIGKTIQAASARAQARELAALFEASRALTSSLEPGQVFAQIAASIRAVIGCDDALIYASEPGEGALRLVAGMGPRSQRLGATRIALDDTRSLAARAAVEGRPHLVGSDAGEVGQVTEVFVGEDHLSLLAAPLISKRQVRGVVVLAHPRPFRPTALAEMATLGNLIAAVLENVSLYTAARAGAEQLAAIFASASDAIALLDAGLRIVEANDAFAALTGVSPRELRTQPCADMLRGLAAPGNPLCEAHGVLAQVVTSGEPVAHVEALFVRGHTDAHVEYVPRRNGPSVPLRAFDFSVTPIRGPHGTRVILVGRDITAQRELEQLQASFLSMISHELRGPLQTVNGYLDLVLGGQAGELNPQVRQYVHRSRAGGQRLATIVDDLLLLSRRDAGQFTLRRESIDLAPLVAEVADEMEVLAEEAGVRLERALPKRLPLVRADGPRIGQVVRNLLSNAIKFTPRGGTVTLEAEAAPEQVLLRVRDTGIGIPPEHQPRIFERFYQVADQAPSDADGSDQSRRERAAGQGLGLAIVRIIVEGHDGTVQVASAPGQGSVFTVTLPTA